MSENVQIINKLINSLYRYIDVVDGLIKDYKVIDRGDSGGVVVYLLLNRDVYWEEGPSGRNGWFNVKDINKRISNLMGYVNIGDFDVVVYFDNSKEDLDKWNKIINDSEI